MDEFSEVYRQYYARVHSFLLGLTGSSHAAEELTQEVFFKALVHMDAYRDRGSMLAWLCTIGKNLWLNECRRGNRFEPLETDLPDTSPTPEESILGREKQAALRKAVAELPEEYRDVVILHIFAGLSLKQIAAERGKSESWGKVTFYRAKSMLSQKLEGFK